MKTSKKRTSSYVFTADPLSVSDMRQVEIVRKTIAVQNKILMENYRRNCLWQEKPVKPVLHRVRLMGRGPRKAAYLENLREGGTTVSGGYRAYLPQRFATSFDVYIARRD
jgi:hypothetical protein